LSLRMVDPPSGNLVLSRRSATLAEGLQNLTQAGRLSPV
jgi:hypothetical protein